jgi:signal transduction histidine kinase
MVPCGSRATDSDPPEATPAVLYVDADRRTASAVAGALEGTEDAEDRFTVVVEDDPETALERIDSEPFDAVVADYDLPSMDGVELLRAVRRTRPRLPFVLFADGGSETVASEAIAAGVTDYLPKRTDEEGVAALSDRLWSAVAEYRGVSAAERASHRVDALAESPIVFTAYIAPDGTVERVDETATGITGVPAARCVGERFWALPWWVDDDDASVVRSHLERAVAGDHTRFRIEYDADGETGTALCVLLPVTVDGEAESIFLVGQDVTDSARHERLLERQNRRLDEFASVVSHDLRNPLSVAEGRLQLARAECDSDHLDHVARAHDRMDALIEDLLALAREDDSTVETAPVALADVADASWRNVRTEDAVLDTETTAVVHADRRRLQQLFENLFRNSVEHGSTGNRTESGADEERGPGVRVTVGDLADGFYVEDDGPGIDPEDSERVFETGYSTSETGTGFGLAIVESVAQSHGWDVTVVEGADGGARFEFTGVAREE